MLILPLLVEHRTDVASRSPRPKPIPKAHRGSIAEANPTPEVGGDPPTRPRVSSMVAAAGRIQHGVMSRARRALPLAAAVVTVLAAAGCDIGDDGPRTTQTRDLAAFTRIDNQDSVDVRLHVGDQQRVQVRAGEKVIDDVRTEVRDGTLHVAFDHDGFLGDDVIVEASVPRLTAIEASGSGDIEADGIDADAFTVRSDGSADIRLDGTATRLALDLDGSGDADASGLAAREARVAVGGSGDVDVHADRRLDVEVDGSGDVRYHGDPSLTRSVDGSGDLTRAD
jgi:hypothetical protein